MKQSIPVVNLQDFLSEDVGTRHEFVASLGKALERFGFVAIENHGIPDVAVQSGYTQSKRVFALNDETKRSYERPKEGCQRGYTSLGRERARGRSQADVKEFWHVGPELTEDHPLKGKMLENLWPEELSGFREEMMNLWDELHNCGRSLMMALAEYLGEEPHAFASMIDGGDTILRSIRYPGPDEVKPQPGAVWAAAHEDINLITLLVSAKGSGLELKNRDGAWMAIEPIEGQLIVDTGDMFKRITNGRFPATTHRVVAPMDADGPRYSMPFFIHPRADYVLKPVDSCVRDEHPRKWDDITAREYLRERLLENGVLEEAGAS